MDIISNDLKILKDIYTIYNEWILEFDRDKIDKIFNRIVGYSIGLPRYLGQPGA